MPEPVVLLTGFEPFGGESVNPSWLVARALNGADLGVADGADGTAATVVSVCLPCEFGASRAALRVAMRRHRPALVLALGQAATRAGFTVERVAINVDDARIPDNAGAQPIDEPVLRGGPAAYFATLPIKAMVAALHRQGWPAEVSQTAGTYVCNHVFYALMHALNRARRRGVRGGFMHLPLLPEQARQHAAAGVAGVPLDVQIEAVRTALRAALCNVSDVVASGGAES